MCPQRLLQPLPEHPPSPTTAAPPCRLVSDDGRTAGSRLFSAPVAVLTTITPIPTDYSDAISVNGDAAIAAGSPGFSASATAVAVDASSIFDDSDNAISGGDARLQLLGLKGPLSRQLASLPTYPTSSTTATTILSEAVAQVLPSQPALPSLSHAANTNSVCGVSAADVGVTAGHSTSECCSDTFTVRPI